MPSPSRFRLLVLAASAAVLGVGLRFSAPGFAQADVPVTVNPVNLLPPPVLIPDSTTTSSSTTTTIPAVAVGVPGLDNATSSIPIGSGTPGDPTGSSTTIDLTASTTTTTDPNASTTTTTLPEIVDVSQEDATPEEPLPKFIPVLPKSSIGVLRNSSLEQLLAKLTLERRKVVAIAQAKADAAQIRVARAQDVIQGLRDQEKVILASRAKLDAELEATRATIRRRAIDIYAGADIDQLDYLLRADDLSTLARRVDVVGQAQRIDSQLISKVVDQQAQLDSNVKALELVVRQKQDDLALLLEDQRIVEEELSKVQTELNNVNDSAAIALNGFVFPVAPPFSFVDTFGAPRMTGTKYSHSHEGVDIFAARGTPLLATTRGIIAKKGVAVLGGNKLWLVGADGTQYYYAHLTQFGPGIEDGAIVEAGQVLGSVGNTGNALTTPPHLHFEIHPGGGPAINPFPILDAVRRSDLTQLLAVNNTLGSVGPVTTTIPEGQVFAGIGVTRDVALDPEAAVAEAEKTSTTVVGSKVTTTKPGTTTKATPTTTIKR